MILEKKISYFKHTRDTECVKDDKATIGAFLERFKDGEYKTTVEKIRGGESELKKSLPTIAMHGIFDGYRKKGKFIEASGIIILDIDDIVEDIEDVKEDIMDSSDHVVAVMRSPSGNGIKVLYYAMPEIVTAQNYLQIGKALVDEFSFYGKVDFLSVTDTLIATYDPKILINENASPNYVHIKDLVIDDVELEELDESIPLWENVEDFFDTVLHDEIAARTNNNYHYIQVAVFDLAKFGFKHPEEDLSFIIDYSENEFKVSSENKNRFQAAVNIAANQKQTRHPYRLIHSDDPDDGFVDYTEFQTNGEPEIESDGFVNYSNMFDKVIAVAKEGNRVGREISYKNFADIFRPKGTGILTVTGIPTSGKTEAVDAITLDLARLYGEESIIAGYEQSPEEHILKLMRRLEGRDIRCKTWLKEKNMGRAKELYDFITSKYTHIDTFNIGGNINTLLELFAKKIQELRNAGRDPKYVVIDPFNLLSIKGKFSGHEKVEEILRRLTEFSHKMGVMVILIAHPFKMKKDEKTGKYDVPDFYSIKGSSAFYEMSYHGLVIHRDNGQTLWRVLKVKQNNMGQKDAEAYFAYEMNSGRYIPLDENQNEMAGTHRDTDWLEKVFKKKN